MLLHNLKDAQQEVSFVEAVKIRDGTKNEEIIGVRRHWIHPWRETKCTTSNVYYDLTILS